MRKFPACDSFLIPTRNLKGQRNYRVRLIAKFEIALLILAKDCSSRFWVERPIRTIQREYLQQVLFWNALYVTRKVKAFRSCYSAQRVHHSLGGTPPAPATQDHYAWQQNCHGLFQIPVAG